MGNSRVYGLVHRSGTFGQNPWAPHPSGLSLLRKGKQEQQVDLLAVGWAKLNNRSQQTGVKRQLPNPMYICVIARLLGGVTPTWLPPASGRFWLRYTNHLMNPNRPIWLVVSARFSPSPNIGYQAIRDHHHPLLPTPKFDRFFRFFSVTLCLFLAPSKTTLNNIKQLLAHPEFCVKLRTLSRWFLLELSLLIRVNEA